jgi:hypothetical protein
MLRADAAVRQATDIDACRNGRAAAVLLLHAHQTARHYASTPQVTRNGLQGGESVAADLPEL